MNRESAKSRIENGTTRIRSDNSIFNPTQLSGSLIFSKVPSEVAGYDTHFPRKVHLAFIPQFSALFQSEESEKMKISKTEKQSERIGKDVPDWMRKKDDGI